METKSGRVFYLLTLFGVIVVVLVGFTLEVGSQENEDRTILLPLIKKPSEWVLECIECDHTFISELPPRAAALDSEGQPHMVYGGEYLFHAYLTDDGYWEKEIVDPTQGVGSGATLALDTGDRPHIIYLGTEGYRYAYFDGTEYQIEDLPSTINSLVGDMTNISIDVDSDNRPHISFIDSSSEISTLMYAFRDESIWQITPITSQNSDRSELVLDKLGRPHIVTADDEGIIYAQYDGSNWEIERVPAVGWSASMALDSNDNPHIAVGPGMIEYLHKNDSGWQLEVVDEYDYDYDFCPVVGVKPSIAVDDLDRPHITYFAFRSGASPYTCERYVLSPYYGVRTQMGWVIEYIEFGRAGSYSSIMVENHSTVHIFYKQGDQIGNLKKDSRWTNSIIDHSRVFGSHISLVMDSSDNPYVSYFELESFQYYLAAESDGAWSTRSVAYPDTGGCVDCRSSITIGPDNTLHMFYQNNYRWRFQRDPAVYHVTFRGLDVSERLLAVCEPGCLGPTASDSLSRPHVMLRRFLWIGEFDEDTYEYQWTVDGTDILQSVQALAVDTANRPLIAGSINGVEGIEYAIKTDSGWITETISVRERFSSMALDPAGTPHFALLSRNPHFYPINISYIYFDGSKWQQEIIYLDPAYHPYGACDPGIAIDQRGGVHIAYESVSHKIMYGYRDGSGWQHPVELDDGGGGCSLALDSTGRPFIVFRGGIDLKIIYKALPW